MERHRLSGVAPLALLLGAVVTLAASLPPTGDARGAVRPPGHPAQLAPALSLAEESGAGCDAAERPMPTPPGDPPAPPRARRAERPVPSVSPDPLASASPAAVAHTGRAARSGFLQAAPRSPDAAASPLAEPAPSQGPPAAASPLPAPSAGASAGASVEPAPTRRPRRPRPSPTPYIPPGIDISHHNGDIDFARVRDAGHRFVYIKATQDTAFMDDRFAANLAGAKAAGLVAGAYHFFDYRLDGRAQADHFIDVVAAAGGLEGTLAPVVDVECWPPIGSSVHLFAALRLRDFVERVYERTGRLPVVYTSQHMWREVVAADRGFRDQPLWVACWGCDRPTLPRGWRDWRFWQTGLVRIRGVGRLDGNLYNGTDASLLALAGPPVAIEGGAPFTNRHEVEVDLAGQDGPEVRFSLDGVTWGPWQPVGDPGPAPLAEGDGERILFVQRRSSRGTLAPVASDSVVVDTVPPEVSMPVVALRPGALDVAAAPPPPDPSPLSGASPEQVSVPLRVTWTAADATAGIGGSWLVVTCTPGGSQLTEAELPVAPDTGERRVEADLPAGPDCRASAEARDDAGNLAAGPPLGVRAQLIDADETGAFGWAGEWSTREAPGAVGGRVRVAAGSPGSEAIVGVEGEQAAIVAVKGPDRGILEVLLDGAVVGEADLYSPIAGGPEVVAVVTLPTGGSTRLTVRGTGRANPSATGDGIVLDALVLLEARPEIGGLSPSPGG